MLAVCRDFFEYLTLCNVRFCHWKSNSHLDKALKGKTDLDLLINEGDAEAFKKACRKFNIKKILSPPEKQFPGLEDYLGFDYETGSFIHLHVHYRLILGQKFIKNHRLPIEDVIFKNLMIREKGHPIPVPLPEIELILLIIRIHMKLDYLSLLKTMIRNMQGHFYSPFPPEINDEIKELTAKSHIEKLKDVLIKMKLPLSEAIFTDFIGRFSAKRLTWLDFFKRERVILTSLKEYRRQTGIAVHLKYAWLFLRSKRAVNRFVKPRKKTLCGRGKIISLTGADGSGKSTLLEDLDRWLSWKLSVDTYYYGIPKTNFVKFFWQGIRSLRKSGLDFMAANLKALFWVYMAVKRYAIYEYTEKMAGNGRIVLTDRFPLRDFRKMEEPMDGPQLKGDRGRVESYFAKIETSYYDKIHYPTRIFVLQADFGELRNRKRDLDEITHRTKADAVNAIEERAPLLLINANKPYHEVQLEVKRHIWEVL